MSSCACRIAGKGALFQEPPYIVYCPMHGAAQEMLEMLKELTDLMIVVAHLTSNDLIANAVAPVALQAHAVISKVTHTLDPQ